MQTIANPAKYKLSEQGRKNADIVGDNDGITNLDALQIQKKLLKLHQILIRMQYRTMKQHLLWKMIKENPLVSKETGGFFRKYSVQISRFRNCRQ